MCFQTAFFLNLSCMPWLRDHIFLSLYIDCLLFSDFETKFCWFKYTVLLNIVHLFSLNIFDPTKSKYLDQHEKTAVARSRLPRLQKHWLMHCLFSSLLLLFLVKLWSTNLDNSVASIEAKANVCCVKFSPSSRYHLAFGCAGKK